jgi:hypothetical protein
MRVILILIFTFSFNLFSQIKNTNRNIAGVRFNGYYANTTDFHPIGKSNTIEIRLEPYFIYLISDRFGIGLIGEYQTAFSTLENLELPSDNYGLGILGRYNHPINFLSKNLNVKLLLFAETSISLTNYYNSEENIFPVSKNGGLNYALLRLRPIGLSFDIFKGFNVDLSFCIFKFFPGRWRSLPNIGLSYIF